MKTEENKILYIKEKQSEKIFYPVVGRLAASGQSGEIMVEFNGNRPRTARLLSHLSRKELSKEKNIGREVLLVFEYGDPERPIITGQIENLLEDIVSMEIDQPDINASEANEAVIDGERVVFEAKKEILLKCGKGSIKIQKDGKIVIKGTNLLSRSSGPHRIKGGSVNIN